MPKPLSESYISSIRLEVRDSLVPLLQSKAPMIHEIRASSASYSMLIDEISEKLRESGSDRALKKLEQLRKHEIVNKILTELVVKALENAVEPGDRK